MKLNRHHTLFGLRVAMGALFVYFGVLAVTDPASQLSWLADWVYQLPIVGTEGFIRVLGVVEVLVGLALVLGWYVRIAALLGAGALFGIVVNLGFNEIAYRDAVLLLACLVLASSDEHRFALNP